MRRKRFRSIRWGASLLLLATAGTIVLSFFYKYKETVFINGKIISTSPSVFLKSEIGGTISKVYFNTNDFVNKDDIIAEFTCTSYIRDLNETKEQLNFLKDSLNLSIQAYESQLESSDLAITSLNEYISIYAELTKSGAASEMQQKEYAQRLAQEKLTKGQLKTEFSRRSLELKTKISTVSRQIKNAQSNVDSCIVRSPIDGIVSEVNVKPQELVGEKILIAKIFNPSKQGLLFTLTPRNLPFIEIDQDFEVRVMAYPFDRYGALIGKINSISPLTSDLIDDNTGATQDNTNSSNKVNAFLAKGEIVKGFTDNKSGRNDPILKDGMPIVGLFTSTDKRLIYILSDQFVKIQDSISSMRSRF